MSDVKECPGCVRKPRIPISMIAITKNSCSVCNYERVQKSTLRKDVKTAIRTRNWSLLNKKDRNGATKIKLDILRPFIDAAKGEAEETIETLRLVDVDEQELELHQRHVFELLETVRCLALRRALTEMEKWEIRDDVRLRTTVNLHEIDDSNVEAAIPLQGAHEKWGPA
jgi:hypothetical protein